MVQNRIMDKTNFSKKLKKLIIKNKYLITYIVYGFGALMVEIFSKKLLSSFSSSPFINYFCVFLGFLTAILLNLFFNFNVPRRKYLLSIFYFMVVSVFSYWFQFGIGKQLYASFDLEENVLRILTSGTFFIFSYLVHLNYSFSNTVKIGYAIHPNSSLDLNDDFYEAIEYSDFLHIDIIDETYNNQNVSNDINKVNKLVSLVDDKEIQIHIMSTQPNEYINKINSKNSTFYIHLSEIDNFSDEKTYPTNKYKNIGIVINDANKKEDELKNLISEYKKIMILCVDKPGFSGQKFNKSYSDVLKLVSCD